MKVKRYIPCPICGNEILLSRHCKAEGDMICPYCEKTFHYSPDDYIVRDEKGKPVRRKK